MKKNNSIQEWLPFERILKNGIIKLKNNSYIKIIKIPKKKSQIYLKKKKKK